MFNGFPVKTTITAFEDNQQYVFKFGNSEKRANAFTVTNITVSSGIFTYSNDVKNFVCSAMYKILQASVVLENTSFSKFDNINFEYVDGTALKIGTSWEMFWGLICFENINAHDSACIVFDTVLSSIENANITDSYFEYLRFERFTGHCIQFNNNNFSSGLKFGTINIEPSVLENSGIVYNSVSDSVKLERYFSVINAIGSCNFTIDDIQMNNVLYKYYIKDGKNYSFGTVINSSYENTIIACVINSIAIGACNRSVNIINNENQYGSLHTNVLINKVDNRSIYTAICNVNEFGNIRIDSSIKKFSEVENTECIFKACYKNYKRDSLQQHGLLCYDSTAVNDKKLCIKTNSLTERTGKDIMQYIIADTKLTIIASIPVNQTLQVRVQSTDGDYNQIATANLVGTGTFKVYEIEYTRQDYLGKLVSFGTVTNNDTVIGKFDSFHG